MGWENDFSLPKDVNWSEVLTIAQDQGVDAIALDGLEFYLSKLPQNSTFKHSEESKRILLESIGGLQMVEVNHSNHLTALIELSDILKKKDIPFLIMKGFACGQYYPNPKHRPCGDIDIYPGDKFDESNKALEEAGIEVEPDYYRHTASFIKNVMIENHRVLCDLRGPKKQTQMLEEWLESEANKSLKQGKPAWILNQTINGVFFPTANFNALFLPWHVSAHFVFEKVTLRHLLDWALFLTHDGREINESLFSNAKKEFTYGFSKVADALTNLSIRYLNIPTDDIPATIVEDAISFDNELADRLFEYMFEGKPRERDENVWKFRLNNVKRIWKERWKYEKFYGMSAFSFLMYKVKGASFHVGE